jgi:hypothetical protein
MGLVNRNSAYNPKEWRSTPIEGGGNMAADIAALPEHKMPTEPTPDCDIPAAVGGGKGSTGLGDAFGAFGGGEHKATEPRPAEQKKPTPPQ